MLQQSRLIELKKKGKNNGIITKGNWVTNQEIPEKVRVDNAMMIDK